MANWADLVNYVRANYKIDKEEPGMLKLVFATSDNRSQVVFLWRHTLMNGSEEWLLIESPFAPLHSTPLDRVLSEIGEMVCGGAAAVGDHLTFRHAVPLAGMDANEFERPLLLVTSSADKLEKLFTLGQDSY